MPPVYKVLQVQYTKCAKMSLLANNRWKELQPKQWISVKCDIPLVADQKGTTGVVMNIQGVKDDNQGKNAESVHLSAPVN